MSTLTFDRVPRTGWWWLALGAVLVGAGLRLWQWWLGTSFFMDELAVLHNLTTRPLGRLLSEPLAEAQVAPPLFLLAEKLCLVLFGRSERALRLPALLGSLAALPLLWAVARRLLDERVVPLAVLALAVGFTFIYYSNQVKPYAGDVAVSLLVLWLALKMRAADPPRRRLWVGAGLAGLVLPFYSQASVMFFAGCGAALVLLAYLDAGRPRLRITALVVGAWAVGSACSLLLAQATLRPETRRFMRYFWREGMLPLDAHLPGVFVGDLTERWANGLGWPHPSSLWVVVAVVGAGLLWRQRREAALLLLAPWAMSTGAALLQQFPLRQRLMDFLLPTLILFVCVAFQAVVRWAGRRGRALGGVALAACAAPICYAPTRGNLPPYCVEDAKTLYARLAQARRPGDALYAYYGAGQTLRWYGPRYGLDSAARLGHCYRHAPGQVRNYLREVDAFRGRRVWVVMVHFDPYEARSLDAYLSAIGRRGPRLAVPWRMPAAAVGYPLVYAQRYDLTDAGRAARFAAATFPLPPDAPHPPAEVCWSCYGPQVINAGE